MSERLNPFSIETPLPIPNPKTIVSETGVLLPMYFSDSLTDEKQALDYFSGPTTSFITNVSRGFALSTGMNLTNASNKDLMQLLQSSEDLITDDEDISSPRTRALESFNLAVVIFSQMPEYADSSKYFLLSTNKVAVTPPKNAFELLGRVNELKGFMEDVNSHKISYKNVRKLSLEDKLFRSFSFFQVGKDIPFKEPPKKEEVIEILKSSFH